MRDKVLKILSVIHGLMFASAFVLIAAVALSAFHPEEAIQVFLLRSLGLLIPFGLTWLAARKCRHLWLYAAVCVVSTIAVVLIAHDMPDQPVLALLSIGICLLRGFSRISGREDVFLTPNKGYVVTFILTYFGGLLFQSELLKNAGFYMTFSYLLLLLVYLNLTNLNGYLVMNRKVSNLPGKQIERTNRIMLIVLVVISAAVMLILPASGLDRAFAALGGLILQGIRALAALIRIRETPEEAATASETIEQSVNQGMPEYTGSAPLWLVIISQALLWLAVIAVVLILLLLLVKFVIYLVRRFSEPVSEESDVLEFISDVKETHEKLTPERKSGIREYFSPDSRVRRAYIRMIRKPGKPIVSEALTPAELEAFVGLSGDEKQRELHDRYEEVRYGRP